MLSKPVRQKQQMPLLFEKFIGFFFEWRMEVKVDYLQSLSAPQEKYTLFFSSVHVCEYGLSCVAEWKSHGDLSPLFWGILFIHGGFHYWRKVKCDQQGWLFYVFILTEINNSHNIVGQLLMSWLTSMFSSFSLT